MTNNIEVNIDDIIAFRVNTQKDVHLEIDSKPAQFVEVDHKEELCIFDTMKSYIFYIHAKTVGLCFVKFKAFNQDKTMYAECAVKVNFKTMKYQQLHNTYLILE